MNRWTRRLAGAAIAVVAAAGAAPVQAQQSASFTISDSAFNAGGTPAAGVVPQSASFRITLSAVGDGVAGPSAGAFGLDAGWVAGYAPPGEVTMLRFVDATTLVWNPDRSAGDYALYAGSVDDPFDAAYGTCAAPPLAAASATITDVVAPGDARFYLVTARNRLGEEGPRGHGRPSPVPCP